MRDIVLEITRSTILNSMILHLYLYILSISPSSFSSFFSILTAARCINLFFCWDYCVHNKSPLLSHFFSFFFRRSQYRKYQNLKWPSYSNSLIVFCCLLICSLFVLFLFVFFSFRRSRNEACYETIESSSLTLSHDNFYQRIRNSRFFICKWLAYVVSLTQSPVTDFE